MEKSIKISVIIPIYLVEQYIEKCIESVLEQSYENLEIILVDDGSTDACPEICDKFATKDSKVYVIHKTNGGLSDARNVGVEHASGNYILFLDGDDFFDDEDAIARLIERVKITNVDVLNFSYKKFFEDTKEKVSYFNGLPSMPIILKDDKEGQLSYLTKNGLYIASACNKLIRRELLIDENLKFHKGTYSEDIEWCLRLMMRAKTMDFVCENFYCYRQRHDSISHTIDDKKCKDLCNNILRCLYLCRKTSVNEREYFMRYTAYQYGTFFKVQAQAENKQTECINRLARYRKILSFHGENKKLVVLNILCKMLGYKTTCELIRKIYFLRK